MPLLKGKLSGGIELKATLSPLDVSDIPACQTAELVSETFKELPHARKILLILKALMRPPNCLNSLVGVHTGGVSSYTITLMVLAFCKFQVSPLFQSNAHFVYLQQDDSARLPSCRVTTNKLVLNGERTIPENDCNDNKERGDPQHPQSH